jgi:hypothetical protein
MMNPAPDMPETLTAKVWHTLEDRIVEITILVARRPREADKLGKGSRRCETFAREWRVRDCLENLAKIRAWLLHMNRPERNLIIGSLLSQDKVRQWHFA